MLKISSVRTFEEKISLYNVIFALILGKNSINSDSKTKFRTFIFQLAFMTAILALPRLLGKSSSIDKSWQWSSRKYWRTIGNNHWCFALNDSDNPFKLFNHADTKIVRHIKVKGIASPMDGNLIYWSSRMGKHPQMPRSKAFLLHRQKGKCNKHGFSWHEKNPLNFLDGEHRFSH